MERSEPASATMADAPTDRLTVLQGMWDRFGGEWDAAHEAGDLGLMDAAMAELRMVSAMIADEAERISCPTSRKGAA